MYRFVKRGQKKKVGQIPGTLVAVDDARSAGVTIDIIDYTPEKIDERSVDSVDDVLKYKDSSSITWINVTGLSDVDLLKNIAENFELHVLTMEDVLNTGHRPKTEEFPGYNFTVIKMLSIDEKGELDVEQVSLVLGPTYVISFQERPGDVFGPVRERLRGAKGRIRTMGADYLAYSLLDAVTDHYFVVLEHVGEELDTLEQELMNDPKPEILNRIHSTKRDLFFVRKSVWPLREVVNTFSRDESVFISDGCKIFYRDLYDHTIHVIDTVETFRDVASGIMDLHISITGNKMNEVMKVLTIIATIFIPITFIAGIYGMNFSGEKSPYNMPELNWRYGYIGVWVLMLATTGVMLSYFRRKRWI